MATETKPPQVAYANDAIYASIGKVVSSWATLEVLMDRLIWDLAHASPREGACITAQIPNSSRRLDAIIALVHLHNGDKALIAKYNKLSEKIRVLQLKRNRVTHDQWMADVETGLPVRFEISAAKSLKFGFEHVTTAEINQLVEDIKSLIVEFHGLSKLTMDKLNASLQVAFKGYLAYRSRKA